jgi:hypothetical protein
MNVEINQGLSSPELDKVRSLNDHLSPYFRTITAGIGVCLATQDLGYSGQIFESLNQQSISDGIEFTVATTVVTMVGLFVKHSIRKDHDANRYESTTAANNVALECSEIPPGTLEVLVTRPTKHTVEKHLVFQPRQSEDGIREITDVRDVAIELISIASESGCKKVAVVGMDVLETEIPSKNMKLGAYITDELKLKWMPATYTHKGKTKFHYADKNITVYDVDVLKELICSAETSNIREIVQKIENMNPRSPVVTYFSSNPYNSITEKESAAQFMRRYLERRIDEIVVNRVSDHAAGNYSRERIVTQAKIIGDGTLVEMYKDGVLQSIQSNLPVLLGTDANSIAQIMAGDESFATEKRIRSYEIKLLESLHQENTVLMPDVDTAKLDSLGYIEMPSIAKILVDSATLDMFELKQHESIFHRKLDIRRTFGLLALTLGSVAGLHGVQYELNNYYNNITNKMAIDSGVPVGEVPVMDIYHASMKNPFFRLWADSADAKYKYNEKLKQLLTKAPNSIEKYSKPSFSDMNSQALKSGQDLYNGVGNVNPNSKSAVLYKLEVHGDLNPNGYWAQEISNEFNPTKGNMEWSSDSASAIVQVQTDGALTYSIPANPIGIQDYITVSSESSPKLNRVYTPPVSDTHTGYGSKYLGDYISVPVLEGTKIIAAHDVDHPEMTFSGATLENGIQILVADIPQNYRPGIIVYSVSASKVAAHLKASAGTKLSSFSNNNNLNTIADVKAMATKAWRDFAPSVFDGKPTPLEIAQRMENYLKTSEYSLTPIPEHMYTDGVSLESLLQVTLLGRKALCNTANTVFDLGNPIQAQPVSGFDNQDGSATHDGSGSLTISTNESHMWSVDVNGKQYDATPGNGLSAKDAEFFVENKTTKNDLGIDYKPEIIEALALGIGLSNRRRLKKLFSKITRYSDETRLNHYERTGQLEKTYREINYILYSGKNDAYNPNTDHSVVPDKEVMKEFLAKSAEYHSRSKSRAEYRARGRGRIYRRTHDQSQIS